MHSNKSKNLYNFIRMRLGSQISDREISRRWGMDWTSFFSLKAGKRKVPRIEELEILANILVIPPAIVFEVARGTDATQINSILNKGNKEQITSMLLGSYQLPIMEHTLGEKYLQTVLDRITDSIFTVNVRGEFKDVNQALCVLLDYKEEELLKKSLYDLIPPSETAALLEAFARVYNEGELHAVDLKIQSRNGCEILWDLNAARIEDDEKNPIGIQVIARDITTRKELELGIKKTHARNSCLVQAVPDMMFVLDADGTYLDFVPAQGSQPYRDPETFIGKKVADVMPDYLIGTLMDCITKCITTNEPQRTLYELRELKGLRRYETRLVPYMKKQVLAIARDIQDKGNCV